GPPDSAAAQSGPVDAPLHCWGEELNSTLEWDRSMPMSGASHNNHTDPSGEVYLTVWWPGGTDLRVDGTLAGFDEDLQSDSMAWFGVGIRELDLTHYGNEFIAVQPPSPEGSWVLQGHEVWSNSGAGRWVYIYGEVYNLANVDGPAEMSVVPSI